MHTQQIGNKPKRKRSKGFRIFLQINLLDLPPFLYPFPSLFLNYFLFLPQMSSFERIDYQVINIAVHAVVCH
jgi:hypothetical protein